MPKKLTLEELWQLATMRDVSYELNLWYWNDPTVSREAVEEIRRTGYITKARTYLISMLPQEMYRKRLPQESYDPRTPKEVWDRGEVQIGVATLGQRLFIAQHFANLAKYPLETIAKGYGLEHLLSIQPEPYEITRAT